MASVNPTPKKTRRERAAETRGRMVAAALEVFAEEGYVGARMVDIAARADVAVQTLYFTFHTKPELLQACYDHAVLGPDRLRPQEQPFFARIMTARSGRAALTAFAEGNGEIVARVAAIDEVARAAAHEPEAVEVRENSEQLRRDGYAHVVGHIAQRFGLRSGLEIGTGTDLLLMFGSGAPYLMLRRYGWTHDQYVAWLADTLATQLLARPGTRPG
jgi:AcrR family transcriptional regulator